MRLENEERFVLDNNNLILDMEDARQKYNLEPEEICELLNKQDEEIKSSKQSRTTLLKTVINITEDVLDEALKNSSLNSAYYDKLLDYLDRLLDYSEGDKQKWLKTT